MDTTSTQCTIIVRRPATYFFGGSRSFLVWIDGQRVGKVRPRTAAEFAVTPGEHTVVASMDWLRTWPTRVQIGPGEKVELAIGGRSSVLLKMILPILVAAIAAPLLMAGLEATGGPFAGDWRVRSLAFVALYAVLYMGYVLITPRFVNDYWAVWTLEQGVVSEPQDSALN